MCVCLEGLWEVDGGGVGRAGGTSSYSSSVEEFP